MLEFRKYRDSDFGDLCHLVHSLYSEDSSGEKMTTYKIKKTVGELKKHEGDGSVYVFEWDHEIVGYSILIDFWSNEFGGRILVIDEIYVKPDFRRKGIATSFIGYVEDKGNGSLKGMQLEVSPHNETALRLYRSLGFDNSRNTVLFKKVHPGVQD